MKPFQRVSAVVLALVLGLGCQYVFGQNEAKDKAADQTPGKKANIVVLATGGTIAGAAATGTQSGYTSGKVTIDPPTHHCVLDVHIAEVNDKKLKVLEDFAQQKPADTAAVCDLIKNPKDNQQYVIKI